MLTNELAQYALAYLKYYGYLPEHYYLKERDPAEVFEVKELSLVTAVKDFQQLFHLRTDGEIGPKTLRAMTAPRCGCPDVMMARSGVSKWKHTDLTYYIVNRDSDLSEKEWSRIIEEAWAGWGDVTKLSFKKVGSKNQANLLIDVGTGRRDNFDGPSGVLAWAQLPAENYSGQLLMRFDTAETWVTSGNARGILLLNVACHEFGHMLGLDHSRVETALMAPFYSPNIALPQQNDDITRIVALYGKRTDLPIPPTPEPPTDNGTKKLLLELQYRGEILDLDATGFRVIKTG